MTFVVRLQLTVANSKQRQSEVKDSPTKVKQGLQWLGASQWRIYYHRMRGQLSTTCSNLLKQPNGELLVAVDHNQLRTMASETVDPIDWLHPPPSWAVHPERLVHSINRCSSARAGIRSCNLQHARQPPCLCGNSGYKSPRGYSSRQEPLLIGATVHGKNLFSQGLQFTARTSSRRGYSSRQEALLVGVTVHGKKLVSYWLPYGKKFFSQESATVPGKNVSSHDTKDERFLRIVFLKQYLERFLETFLLNLYVSWKICKQI